MFCVEIKTVTEGFGKENSWTFGNCHSSMKYKSYNTYNETCCQPQGTYQVTCKDSKNDGWHGGYIEIGGKKHCENFKDGSEENHNVSMLGKDKFTNVFSSTNKNDTL